MLLQSKQGIHQIDATAARAKGTNDQWKLEKKKESCAILDKKVILPVVVVVERGRNKEANGKNNGNCDCRLCTAERVSSGS